MLRQLTLQEINRLLISATILRIVSRMSYRCEIANLFFNVFDYDVAASRWLASTCGAVRRLAFPLRCGAASDVN